jgi:hypothetical protein
MRATSPPYAALVGAEPILGVRSLHVVRWTEYERGGHFASLQAADLLVADIRAFVRELPDQQQ